MKVQLQPGTKVMVSGHPATLTDDYQFDFTELTTVQAVGESLRNDPHNCGLNLHLQVPPKSTEESAAEPWVVYDEETETVSAPGYKTESSASEAETQPKPEVKAKPASKVIKATSKPEVETAKKTATKKGKHQ